MTRTYARYVKGLRALREGCGKLAARRTAMLAGEPVGDPLDAVSEPAIDGAKSAIAGSAADAAAAGADGSQ